MVRIYYYNDIGEFQRPACRVQRNVKSNLCTKYYANNKKGTFCGNYCSRKLNKFENRCWRHKRTTTGPAVVLLMISSSARMYNRDLWSEFLRKSDEQSVNFYLVIFHEDMFNCTVRQPDNLLSRYRPFPDIFGNTVLPLKGRHGSMNFAQVYMQMLEYGCKIPHASRCIQITERTIPIRSPKTIYRRALRSKCHLNISYNVGFGPLPYGLPKGPRGKPYAGVNNLAQGLYTVDFLNVALPTVPEQCSKFGIERTNKKYSIVDNVLYEMWREFTGSNLTEFWLLNSYLLHTHGSDDRPMTRLKSFMEKTVENDVYTVAEVPQWRDGWKRTFVFKDPTRCETLEWFDQRAKSYYKGIKPSGVFSLKQIIKYLRKFKRRALFFRQVELP